MEDGLKLAVVPAGKPEALSAIAALKPPVTATVIALEPAAPWVMVSAAGGFQSLSINSSIKAWSA